MTDISHKKIPYGKSDFFDCRRQGYAYVDKTKFIETLEQNNSDYIFIVRPRRFGTTLFTSTLKAYYDIAASSKFEENFANTYIAQHKTKLANSFYVLKLDCSGFSQGNIVNGLIVKLKKAISNFLDRYPFENARYVLQKEYQEPYALLDEFFSEIEAQTGKKIYFIIDEYDQFANDILSNDKEKFQKYTTSQGFLKNFYETLKSATTDSGPIAKIFITGVTSIFIDSLSSGFNIQKNITSNEHYANLFGFNNDELRTLIPQVIDLNKYGHSVAEIFNRMKVLYNGYHFCPYSKDSVFNASMCLYYLDAIQEVNREPRILLDPAFAQDLSKIHSILQLGDHKLVEEIINKALREEPISFAEDLSVINLNSQQNLSENDLLSTMMYFGYLTWKENSDTLTIPNRTVAQQFFEYYFKYLRGIENLSITHAAFKDAFVKLRQGAPEEFVKTVATQLNKAGGLHLSASLHESDFAVALATAANFSPDFNVHLELEVTGKEKGYADLVLSPLDGVNCSYIFELKYLPVSKGSDEAVKEKLIEANAQLDRYCQGDNIAKLPSLKRVACVFVGTDIAALDIR